MKRRLKLLFLAVILLSSCSVMKRKYSSGFTVLWKSKKPYGQSPLVKKALPVAELKPVTTHPISLISVEATDYIMQSMTKGDRLQLKENSSKIYSIYTEPRFPTDTAKKGNVPVTDSLPMDVNARKSGSDGIGAILTALGSFLLLLIGPSLESGTISFLVVFTLFLILGLVSLAFACDAISYAVKAFTDFSKEKGKYSGLNKALLGFILGIVCILYCAVIALAFAAVLKSGAF